MVHLWLVLDLFVLSNLASCVYKSSHQTLDSFISDTADTLEFLRAHKWKERSRFPSKLYNLTDTVTIWDRQLMEAEGPVGHYKSLPYRQVQLKGFCIMTSPMKETLQIASCGGWDSFLIVIELARNQSVGHHAYIIYLNAAATMNGTQCVLLINYILSGIGVQLCSLQNMARLKYQYEAEPGIIGEPVSIPLIHLRCIRGMTSDWYSDFGYLSGNEQQIAREMKRIHDIPMVNSSKSLGPWLLALWNQPDKTDFHRAYRKQKRLFLPLTLLRDGNQWTRTFKRV